MHRPGGPAHWAWDLGAPAAHVLQKRKSLAASCPCCNTRSILDRTTPGPPDPADKPWLPCRWEMSPSPVFVEIPGGIPGYGGQDWELADKGLLPSPPERLDPCHWGGPPNLLWDNWSAAKHKELGFYQQRKIAE